MNARQVADALIAINERQKTSGRPRSELDLAEVLDAALDRYELARLYAVAHARLEQLQQRKDSEIRARLIAEGLIKTQ